MDGELCASWCGLMQQAGCARSIQQRIPVGIQLGWLATTTVPQQPHPKAPGPAIMPIRAFVVAGCHLDVPSPCCSGCWVVGTGVQPSSSACGIRG